MANARRGSQVVAEGIIKKLKEPFMVSGQVLSIGTSIGIALQHAETILQPTAWLEHADAAMYEAKKSGKGRYAIYFEDARKEVGAPDEEVDPSAMS